EPSALPLGAGAHARGAQARGRDDAGPAGFAAGDDAPRGTRRFESQDRAVGRWRRRRAGRGRDAPEDRDRLMAVLVLMEDGDPSLQMLTLAREFGDPLHAVRMDAVQPFAPDALAAILARAAEDLGVSVVFAAGTDRGNDVMARLAART